MSENSEVFYCLEPSCKRNRLIIDYKETIKHVMAKHNLVEYDEFQEFLKKEFSDKNIEKMQGNQTIKYIQDVMLEKIQKLCDQLNILKAYILNVFPNEFDKFILPTSSLTQTAQKFKNLIFSNEYKDNILIYEKEMTQFMEAYQNHFIIQDKHKLICEKIQSDIEAFKFEFDVQKIIDTLQGWINNYDSNNNKLIQQKPINQDDLDNHIIWKPINQDSLLQAILHPRSEHSSENSSEHSSEDFQEYLADSEYEFVKIGRSRQVYLNYHHSYVYSQSSAQILIEVNPDEYHDINLQINQIEPHPGQKNKINIGFFSGDGEEIITVYGKKLIIGDVNIVIDLNELVVTNNTNNFSKCFNRLCTNEISQIILFFTGYEMYLKS